MSGVDPTLPGADIGSPEADASAEAAAVVEVAPSMEVYGRFFDGVPVYDSATHVVETTSGGEVYTQDMSVGVDLLGVEPNLDEDPPTLVALELLTAGAISPLPGGEGNLAGIQGNIDLHGPGPESEAQRARVYGYVMERVGKAAKFGSISAVELAAMHIYMGEFLKTGYFKAQPETPAPAVEAAKTNAAAASGGAPVQEGPTT